MVKNTHNKLLKENITAEYKKSDPGIIEKLIKETYQIINEYNVKGKKKKKSAFNTIKDHIKDFPNKPN